MRTKGSGLEYVCQNDAQGYPVEICEAQIAAGNLVRIPPRPYLPPGLVTRKCRLPKKGERFADIDGDVFCATEDWVAIPACVYYGRRWIVVGEPAVEKPAPAPLPANPCIREIVADWLQKHDFDGLCNTENECGCTLDDLIPCIDGLDGETCQAGYKGPVDKYGETMMYLTREAAEAAEKEQDDE